MRPKVFANIVVHPTQTLLKPPYALYRGGPDWPRFWAQIGPRHCRYPVPVPLDRRPSPRLPAVTGQRVGAWCGPLTKHFGHAIADFGGRLAYSSQLPDSVPLVFSASPEVSSPPAFLHQILSHFGVDPSRLLVVDQPTAFERLFVFPQAERLYGGPPKPTYLDLLDRLAGNERSEQTANIFVPRTGRPNGRIACDGYLEWLFQRAGFETFRPEQFTIAEQLSRYQSASRIVFVEGSAVHALQLVGRIRADVSILARRPGSRIARNLIAPRVSSLHYVDCLRGVVHGVRLDGTAQPAAGISILDHTRLVSELAKVGIDIAPFWHEQRYLQERDADVRAWIQHRSTRSIHRSEHAVIRKSATSAGLQHLFASG